MRSALAFLVVVATAAARADEPGGGRDGLDAAINRGLAFLAKDAVEWKEEHNCVSCHHAGLVVWSLREAKARGYAVDEPVLAEMTRWIAESGDGKTSQARPEGRPQAFNAKALWLALGLGADPEPDDAAREGLRVLLETVRGDQTEDGSWSSWPDTRPPIFASDDSVTALATLAILPAADRGDEAAKAARDRAARRLAETKTDDDPQSVAMRLVVLCRLDRPDGETRPLADRIRARQNADGGWSQAEGMPSDAWATGQALYALAHAGASPDDDPAIAKGRAFLVRTQRDDGSWPMTSRPIKPDGKGAENLVPITAAGSAWGVLGLVRSR